MKNGYTWCMYLNLLASLLNTGLLITGLADEVNLYAAVMCGLIAVRCYYLAKEEDRG